LQKAQKSDKAVMAGALDGYLQALLSEGKLDKVFEEGARYVNSDFANVAFLRMAEAKLKLNDRGIAVQYCQKVLAKMINQSNEGFQTDYNILQRMCSLLGTEEVIKDCKEAYQANPNLLTANLTMFNLMKINAEYNKAINYIDRCLQIAGSDSRVRFDYVVQKALTLQMAYMKTSDNNYLKKAVAEYESLLAEMPNNTSVLNNLAYILTENNERLADALEYAKRAYQANPNNPDLMDTYAYALYKNGKYVEADGFLQSALQQYEAQRIATPADIYEHIGLVKEKLGEVPQAVAAYKQALEKGKETLSEVVKERIKAAIERFSQQNKPANK